MRLVAPGVWHVEATGGSSNAFLVEADVYTLVDTGMPRKAERVLDELRAAYRIPARILLTHGDVDHLGGAALIARETSAEVWAPAAERPFVERDASFDPGRPRRLVGRIVRVEPPPVARWLEDGDDAGGLRAVATPGHTLGHMSYLFGRTLIAGDAVVTLPHRLKEAPLMFTADILQARASIAKLAELDVETIVSGHGPATGDGSAKLRKLAERVGS